MAQTDLSIRRLLRRKDAKALLSLLSSLIPDIAVALVEPDGEPFLEEGRVGAPPPEISLPMTITGQVVGHLVARGARVEETQVQDTLALFQQCLNLLLICRQESRSLADETLERYREINLLYNIGENISACLDPDTIPSLVLEEAVRVIETDLGGVLLLDGQGGLRPRAGYGDPEAATSLWQENQTEVAALLRDGLPHILTHEQFVDSRGGTDSLLCAPLKTRERTLGLVVLGRGNGREIFTASDQKLLSALAGQAAIAIENAQLFADVKEQRDAIAEMKSYMDNIFASIASGVITTDITDLVTILNRAAEHILGVDADVTMGQPYKDALPGLGYEIEHLMDSVKRRDMAVFGYEMQPVLPNRGSVDLRLHLSPLKNNHKETTGIAIVVDDLTQQRRLEARMRQVRQTFERYVSPQVVEELLSDSANIQLGGVHRQITVLFADIRGFTAFTGSVGAEVAVGILNRHLALAAGAILGENGTLDKFIGDAVMAFFNAPLAQSDHTLRAVRAAWHMQRALRELHAETAAEHCLHFGIAIVRGMAVVGNVGSPDLQNYTAIGDSVNLASRLQALASPGVILLDADAHQEVREQVTVEALGAISIKGYSEPRQVFKLVGLQE
ncbi:MAG: adenylate/guanylate cyclase domain-containing protein [Anaerolineales bacterium]